MKSGTNETLPRTLREQGENGDSPARRPVPVFEGGGPELRTDLVSARHERYSFLSRPRVCNEPRAPLFGLEREKNTEPPYPLSISPSLLTHLFPRLSLALRLPFTGPLDRWTARPVDGQQLAAYGSQPTNSDLVLSRPNPLCSLCPLCFSPLRVRTSYFGVLVVSPVSCVRAR